jgi:hypothetical protein
LGMVHAPQVADKEELHGERRGRVDFRGR